MTSFLQGALGGNPFSTPVGEKIERATDASLASENWQLNIEICDLVNDTEEGPRDAIKAIRKRLTTNVVNKFTVVMYTLTVLETCVKNCGRKFHVLVCSKDFVQELVKLIMPKNDPPTVVQEKVLSLIQSWADAFKNQPELSGVVSVYNELKAKKIDFPATDLDAMVPIHTPQKSVETEMPAPVDTRSRQVLTSPAHQQISSSTGALTPEQRNKLQSELDVVQSNMAVLSEMLSEVNPNNEQPDELELLQELNIMCRKMQERLMDLIQKLSDTELTEELIRINDDMNNLFLRYDRWEKNRKAGGQSASTILAKAMAVPEPQKDTTEPSLIDFGHSDDLPERLSRLGSSGTTASAQLATLGTVTATNGPPGNDEFDMFAQSRNVTYESSKTSGSTYKDNLEPEQLDGLTSFTQTKQKPNELEIDEMSAWLGEGTEEAVTSSEFERFLAERAAAAEALPSSNTRQTKKEDKDGVFAL